MNTSPERRGGAGTLLRLEDLHAEYKVPVLRGVELEVAAGEVVALVGPNGAGKTSLLRAVAGLLRPTGGRVWFDGQDITTVEPHRRARRGIAYVKQGGKIFGSLTVAENLEMGMLFCAPGEKSLRREEMCAAFPVLRDVQGARAGLLSGGLRQVLALASKLVARPRLLLLDEPAVGLSPRLAADVFEHLGAVNRERGTSVLFVERRTAEAMSIAHRIEVVTDGRIKGGEDGTPPDTGPRAPAAFAREGRPARKTQP